MTLQIADPVVLAKVERLAREAGVSQTALVEQAVDLLARDMQAVTGPGRMMALLRQIDLIPERIDAADLVQWDEQGLPA